MTSIPVIPADIEDDWSRRQLDVELLRGLVTRALVVALGPVEHQDHTGVARGHHAFGAGEIDVVRQLDPRRRNDGRGFALDGGGVESGFVDAWRGRDL